MRVKQITLLALILVFFQTACALVEKVIDPVKKERKAIVSKRYENDGLSFSYPDNWQVTEDLSIENGLRHVNIEDSDSSLYVLNIMSSEFEVDLEDYATNFVKDLPANLQVGKIVKVEGGTTSRVICGRNYNGVRRRYSVSLLGEVVPNTADFFLIAGEKTNALLMIMSPDEDLTAAEKEFQMFSDSLRLD